MQSLFFARMSDRFSLHETNHCSGSGQCGDVDLAMNSQKPRICAEVQVMFFDTDSGGVVSNIAYLRFIETARTLLAEELGLRRVDMARTQQYPVVVRTEIHYRRAAKFGDRQLPESRSATTELRRFGC